MSSLSKGKIYIKKRSTYEWLVLLIFFLPFLFGTLIEFFKLPDIVRFIPDVAIILLLFFLVINRKIISTQKNNWAIIFLMIFISYVLINYVFNYQSIFYFYWGFRNNFRYYFVFLFFVFFLSEYDTERMLKSLDVVFWINFAVCIFQFIFLDYRQDFLGGIFGVTKGCNAYVNVFFCVIITKSVIYFINKKERLLWVVFKCLATMIVAAMAELKFFFIEFVIIFFIAFLVTHFTWRKLLIMIISVIFLQLGLILLFNFFPSFSKFFNLDTILNASKLSGYSSADDLNRLTAIPVISRNILETDAEKWFGLGLGNCDLSSIELLNTPFYESYSFLNYNWFSTAFLFLELGYTGLILHFSFYIISFVVSYNYLKKNRANPIFCQMAMITSVLACVFTIYDASMRLDCAFMIYFILALPYIDLSYRKNTEFFPINE